MCVIDWPFGFERYGHTVNAIFSIQGPVSPAVPPVLAGATAEGPGWRGWVNACRAVM